MQHKTLPFPFTFFYLLPHQQNTNSWDKCSHTNRRLSSDNSTTQQAFYSSCAMRWQKLLQKAQNNYPLRAEDERIALDLGLNRFCVDKFQWKKRRNRNRRVGVHAVGNFEWVCVSSRCQLGGVFRSHRKSVFNSGLVDNFARDGSVCTQLFQWVLL